MTNLTQDQRDQIQNLVSGSIDPKNNAVRRYVDRIKETGAEIESVEKNIQSLETQTAQLRNRYQALLGQQDLAVDELLFWHTQESSDFID